MRKQYTVTLSAIMLLSVAYFMMPSAFAQDVGSAFHSTTVACNIGSCLITTETDPAGLAIPDGVKLINSGHFVYHDHNQFDGSYTPPTNPSECGFPDDSTSTFRPPAGQDRLWVQVDNAGQAAQSPVGSSFDNPFDTESEVIIDQAFGTGDPGTPNPNLNSQLEFDDGGSYGWREVLPDGSISLTLVDELIPGRGFALTCGFGDASGDLIWQAQEPIFLISEGFFVDAPIGGELATINTSALFLAGIGANAAWLLPMVIAGTGIYLATFRLGKVEE